MDALFPIGRLNGSPQTWVSTSGAAAALRSQLEVQRESLEPVERRTYAEAEGLPKEGLDRVPGGACGGCMPRARLQADHDERECIHRRRGWRPWPRRFASRRGRAPPRLRGMRTARALLAR